MDWLDELREYVDEYSTAPTLEEMPRLTLADKGIQGPTNAHKIEEIHTPFNCAFVTFTTGSSAFQNIVGVTHSELTDRKSAAYRALELCGLSAGDCLLFTYPPLVNVFTKEALTERGIHSSFLKVSSRDAVLLAIAQTKPKAVIGESTFLRVALEKAKDMGFLGMLPSPVTFIAAGTPLDLGLPPIAAEIGSNVHDLYGCQEFGWLACDGIALRDDLSFLPAGDGQNFDLLVGGLPTGDRFPIIPKGHLCGHSGSIITYNRQRTARELEPTVMQTTAHSAETVERLARTILRIKAKIVKVSPKLITDAAHTVLSFHSPMNSMSASIEGPKKTREFDSLLQAQIDYQTKEKSDATWNKLR